ncbi:MAG TPA: hypothetical protein VF491_26695, partial [Vicinamibacterales bacterium]
RGRSAPGAGQKGKRSKDSEGYAALHFIPRNGVRKASIATFAGNPICSVFLSGKHQNCPILVRLRNQTIGVTYKIFHG